MTRYALLILAFATAARADVWKDASTRGKPDPNRDTYNAKLTSGDELAIEATAAKTRAEMRRLVGLAASSYREAATAEPSEAEPYFRLGELLYSFYLECVDQETYPPSMLCDSDPSQFDRQHAQQLVDTWDAAEARAPLDPRFSVTGDEGGILFRRAILNTRLHGKKNLEAAARDYEAFLSRAPGDSEGAQTTKHNVLSNLAETYMMLDRLDDAIEMYRRALEEGPSVDTAYGLAVALDRDGHASAALDQVRAQTYESWKGRNGFWQRVTIPPYLTFFVPDGEKYYYFALIEEAFAHYDESIRYWKAYIASGAHPEFQLRAKQHIEALQAEVKKHPVASPQWGDDPFQRFAP